MSKVTEEMVEAAARGICKSHNLDPDSRVQYSGTRRFARNSDGSFVRLWEMFAHDARAALEAVLDAEAPYESAAQPISKHDPDCNLNMSDVRQVFKGCDCSAKDKAAAQGDAKFYYKKHHDGDFEFCFCVTDSIRNDPSWRPLYER